MIQQRQKSGSEVLYAIEDTRVPAFAVRLCSARYIVDFCSAHPKLVIELDGGQHEDQKRYDEARTRYLVARGYLVLRFWNTDVIARLDDVLTTIVEEARKLGAA